MGVKSKVQDWEVHIGEEPYCKGLSPCVRCCFLLLQRLLGGRRQARLRRGAGGRLVEQQRRCLPPDPQISCE